MKTRIFAGVVLALTGMLLCCPIARCADESSDIKVLLDIPEIQIYGKLRPRTLANQDPKAHFFVIIENVSSRPLLISRGNGQLIDLYFEVTDDAGKTTVIHEMHPAYSAYVNDNVRLAPGQCSVVEIHYVGSGAEKYDFPFPAKGKRQDVTIRAVLETKPFENAGKQGVWTGRAVSGPYKVVLENNTP